MKATTLAATILIAGAMTAGIVFTPIAGMVSDAFAAESAAQLTLEIDGLDCGSCSPQLRKAFRSIEGVTDAKPGAKKSHVVVTYDAEKTSSAAILQAVRKEGLSAKVVR